MPLDRPLIGFNVVEQLIPGTKDGADLMPILASLICGAMNLQDDKAITLVNFFQIKLTSDYDSN